MASAFTLETGRLLLRQWRKSDYLPFAALNSDPKAMAYFPSTLSKNESDKMADRIASLISLRGWGVWALEEKNSQQFIGFTGLHEPTAELPCSPCVEIAWRLSKHYWGKGYATEAAEESLRYAFEVLDLMEVYAFTPIFHVKSRKVMRRIHMHNTFHNFAHPEVPPHSPFREHTLYKITKPQWSEKASRQ